MVARSCPAPAYGLSGSWRRAMCPWLFLDDPEKRWMAEYRHVADVALQALPLQALQALQALHVSVESQGAWHYGADRTGQRGG